MKRATSILLGIAALLVLVLAFEWRPTSETKAVTAHVARPEPARARVQAAVTETGEWVDTILERPLFTPSRKPSKTAEGGKGFIGPGVPRLSGIMIMPGVKRAIFMPDGGKPLVLAEGAAVGDSVIRSIAPDHVVIGDPNGAGKDTMLRPTYDKQHLPAVVAPLYPQPPGLPGPIGGVQPPNMMPFRPPPIPPQPAAQQGEAGDEAGTDNANDGAEASPPPPGAPPVSAMRFPRPPVQMPPRRE